MRRPLIVGATVGAAFGARHAAGALGEPMTARESSTAKGTARFLAVEAGAEALFCGEEIEWTIVDVCDMVEEGEIALVLRERWENKCTAASASEARARRRHRITKTTPYPRI